MRKCLAAAFTLALIAPAALTAGEPEPGVVETQSPPPIILAKVPSPKPAVPPPPGSRGWEPDPATVKPSESHPSSWEVDPFWTVFGSYNRAEMMYRRYTNRLCSFEEHTPGVFGAHRDMRATLDQANGTIERIWPGRMAESFDVFATESATRVDLCDDKVAAWEAFGAALTAKDMLLFVLNTFERERLARGED